MPTNLWVDGKYAWRLLIKSPVHSFLCAVVVALSVGLALWAYVLVRTLLLSPLPFPGGEHWWSVQMAPNRTAQAAPSIDAYTYQSIVSRSRSVDHLGAYSTGHAVLSENDASTSLNSGVISPSLLAAMRPTAFMGRVFGAADAAAGAAPTVILSYGTWHDYFAADPAIIGKSARIDGRPAQIIGVMPHDFDAYFDDFELIFPLLPRTLTGPADASEVMTAFVRLKDGQKPDDLLAQMQPAVEEVNRAFPQAYDSGRHLELIPGHLTTSHSYVPYATMISFISFAVLLLGCVNISLVFYARFLERSGELALRSALGSSRARLLRQCLLETVFVVVAGLLTGIALAAIGVKWARGIGDTLTEYLANGRDPNPMMMRADSLLAGVALALLVWLLSTLIPAWRISKQDPVASLGGGGKGAMGRDKSRTVAVLVGLQVIISSLVLVICISMSVAVREETGKSTGIDTAHVMLSTYPTVFSDRYPNKPSRRAYLDGLAGGIKSRIAGADVAYATQVPTRATGVPMVIENMERAAGEQTLKIPVTAISQNYFDLLGVTLRSGRVFDTSDDTDSHAVAIVDEVAARRYWPGQTALGKRIQLKGTAGGTWMTIVGVVSAVGHEPFGEDTGVVYQPLQQGGMESFLLITKLPSVGQDFRHALRAAAYAQDPDMPLHNLQMLSDYLRALNMAFTLLIPPFTVIAVLTVVLAASGLFGLISRSVARRTREIGLRRALGGSPSRIIGMFLRSGSLYLGVAVVGSALGGLVASQISHQIPNILAHAMAVIAIVFVILGTVIFFASYLPSRRAVSLEPADALRYE